MLNISHGYTDMPQKSLEAMLALSQGTFTREALIIPASSLSMPPSLATVPASLVPQDVG